MCHSENVEARDSSLALLHIGRQSISHTGKMYVSPSAQKLQEKDAHHCCGDFDVRVHMQGIQKFSAMEGGPPDVVMIASNFWDIAALCVSSQSCCDFESFSCKWHTV